MYYKIDFEWVSPLCFSTLQLSCCNFGLYHTSPAIRLFLIICMWLQSVLNIHSIFCKIYCIDLLYWTNIIIIMVRTVYSACQNIVGT